MWKIRDWLQLKRQFQAIENRAEIVQESRMPQDGGVFVRIDKQYGGGPTQNIDTIA